jgi:cellulose synthase/poly-beta-1,6-N-acetylglucosamine synthase-like glycosyltransferase
LIILRLSKPSAVGYIEKSKHHTLYPFFGGANIAFRRACLDELGGFDNQMLLGEDTDICIRVFRSPWKVFAMKDARVTHKAHHGVFEFVKKWYRHGIYMAAVFSKHNSKAAEIFVRQKTSDDPSSIFQLLLYTERVPLSIVIFMNQFMLAHACMTLGIILLFLTNSWYLPAGFSAIGTLLFLRYLASDIRANHSWRTRAVNGILRYLWNLAILLGGIHGSFRYRMILLNSSV